MREGSRQSYGEIPAQGDTRSRNRDRQPLADDRNGAILVRTVAEQYVGGIFRRLREHGYDESTMDLIVTGGGGCLVKNFYRTKGSRVRFIDDIRAAAKGYEYLAGLQLKSERGV